MQVRAIAKNIRISPRKVRLIADAIRNRSVVDAQRVLGALDQQAARPLMKTLNSAVANAVNNAKLDAANLTIGSLQVSDGQALKRFRPSTRGRIHPYKKRGSTITVILKEMIVQAVVTKPVKADASASSAQVKKEAVKEKKEVKK